MTKHISYNKEFYRNNYNYELVKSDLSNIQAGDIIILTNKENKYFTYIHAMVYLGEGIFISRISGSKEIPSEIMLQRDKPVTIVRADLKNTGKIIFSNLEEILDFYGKNLPDRGQAWKLTGVKKDILRSMQSGHYKKFLERQLPNH